MRPASAPWRFPGRWRQTTTQGEIMRSRLLLSVASAAFATIAGPSLAQDAGPATVDEIVVTAQKLEENLQKVSVAVTAVGGEELAERNVINPRELIYLSPSLQLPSNNINS